VSGIIANGQPTRRPPPQRVRYTRAPETTTAAATVDPDPCHSNWAVRLVGVDKATTEYQLTVDVKGASTGTNYYVSNYYNNGYYSSYYGDWNYYSYYYTHARRSLGAKKKSTACVWQCRGSLLRALRVWFANSVCMHGG
jgi:hypothetical protein